jgi:hypothetical protein
MRKLAFAFLAICAFGLILWSCQKKDDGPKKPDDNPCVPVQAKPVDSLLTAVTWKLQEARWLQQNTMYHYERGVSNNEASFGMDSIRFRNDGTGSYTNISGTAIFNWKFNNVEKSKIQLTLHDGLIVNWENVYLSSNIFRYGESFTLPNGTSSLGTYYRTPR